jgi:hypothetical protein
MKPILTAKRPKKTWHAVSVAVKAGCCEAAKQRRNVRFLSAEAPRFPLENCTNPEDCQCAYRHFDDRRAGSRRQREMGLRKSRKGQQERRQGADRRRAEFDF